MFTGGLLACLVSPAELGFARPPIRFPLRLRVDFEVVRSTLESEEVTDLFSTDFELLLIIFFDMPRFGIEVLRGLLIREVVVGVGRGVFFLSISF